MTSLWLAVEAVTATDPVGGLLQYGVLGAVVVAMLTGVLVPGRTAKRAEDESDRLRTLIEERVLPLVHENTRVTEQAIQILAELQAEPRAPRRRGGS